MYPIHAQSSSVLRKSDFLHTGFKCSTAPYHARYVSDATNAIASDHKKTMLAVSPRPVYGTCESATTGWRATGCGCDGAAGA